MKTTTRHSRFFPSSPIAALLLLLGLLTPARAAEIWVVPQQEKAPRILGHWVVADGDTHFVFGIPDDFESFRSAQVILIGRKNLTMTCDVGISISVDGASHNQFSDAILELGPMSVSTNQLKEIDVSAIIPPLVPGIDTVALSFRSSRPADTYVVGLRFQYESDAAGVNPGNFWRKTDNFNGDVAGLGTNLQLKPGIVGSSDLAADSVDSSKIQDGSVSGSDLAPGSVAAANIQPGAVGSSAIADGSVTLADLASNSVDSATIANGSVQAVDLALNSVTTDKLADGSVNLFKLSANSVGTAKIINGSIQAVDLANDSVGTAALQTGAVDSAEIKVGAVRSLEVQDNSLTSADLATGAVGSDEILNGSIQGVDVDDSQIQRRVGSSCGPGSSIRTINSNGTVVCQPDNGGLSSFVTRLVVSPLIPGLTAQVITLSCNAGEALLSGGCENPLGAASRLHYSGPLSPTQWRLKLENLNLAATQFACRVVCLVP